MNKTIFTPFSGDIDKMQHSIDFMHRVVRAISKFHISEEFKIANNIDRDVITDQPSVEAKLKVMQSLPPQVL